MNLTLIDGPSGLSSVTFTPSLVTPAAGGFASASLAVAVGRTAPTGTFLLTVRAQSTGLPARDARVELTVNAAPDVTIAVDAPSRAVTQGQNASFTVTAQSRNGFVGQVTLSLLGLPSGVGSGGFSPNPLTLASNGSTTAILTIATNLSAPPGTFPLTIRASAAGVPERELALSLTVLVRVTPPEVSEGGVVSAASFVAPIVRCAIASLFGSGLATQTLTASVIPLPKLLGGVRVSVDGEEAALFSVSSRQVNFQVPCRAALSGRASVILSRDGVASKPVDVTLAAYAPGVFTYERAPAVFDPVVTLADGTLVSAENAITADSVFVVYGTGLGDLSVVPVTGEPSPSRPAETVLKPVIVLGETELAVEFAGLTPGSVGLAQFNARAPKLLPAGVAALPLVIRFGDAVSPVVHVAVRGGQ